MRLLSKWLPTVVVGGSVAAIVLWFAWPLIALVANRYLFATDFDRDLWREADAGAVRMRMLDDLIDNELPGKTRTQVINLLGEPANRRFESDIAYAIGRAGIDHFWLGVDFGLDSHVARTAVFSD